MLNKPAPARGTVAIVANRRLDKVHSGSTAYLRAFIEEVERSGLEPRLVMSPLISFGNLPWARIDPAFQGGAVVWRKSLRWGTTYLSLSPLVWARFGRRLVQETAIRLGMRMRIRSQLSDTPRGWERRAVLEAVRGLLAGAVVVEYSSLGPLLDDLSDIPARYVLMHDLFSKRAELFRAIGEKPDHADLSLEDEAAMCAGATDIVYISLAERESMAPLLPNTKHLWLKPAFRVRREALRARTRPIALFVGADHAGNRDALAHFLNDVWPLLLERAPQAKLVVAGAIGRFAPHDTPGDVEIVGPVEDLAMFAGPDVIGLAPIRLGSGTPIKVADYMGLGMPVVAYTSSVAGFGARLGDAILCADTAMGYAEHVAALLHSAPLRASMSEAALTCAEQLRDEPGIAAVFQAVVARA